MQSPLIVTHLLPLLISLLFLQSLRETSEIVQFHGKFDFISFVVFIPRTIEVYMTDLVSSISFSLRREIPKIRVIKGDALKALKEWVNLLSKVSFLCFSNFVFRDRYLYCMCKME